MVCEQAGMTSDGVAKPSQVQEVVGVQGSLRIKDRHNLERIP